MPSKQGKKKISTGSTDAGSTPTAVADERFARLHRDPRFVRPKARDTKVIVDDRFKAAVDGTFTDFTNKDSAPIVDRYGRKQAAKGKGKGVAESMRRYYRLEEDGEDNDESSDDNEVANVAEPSMYDLARGKAILESSSDEEEGESDDDEDDMASVGELEQRIATEMGQEHIMMEGGSSSSSSSLMPPVASLHPLSSNYDSVPQSSIPSGDKTYRFAVVNMDWDHITSRDLFKVFDAFKPLGGKILKVSIYPSEFGKERIEREQREGPQLGSKIEESKEEDENKPLVQVWREEEAAGKNSAADNVKLREYQLQRLRYYYAVCVTDSISTADGIYQACDGTEYESSANFFDLRFIPDEISFDDDEPRDECFETPGEYRTRDFQTRALQHSTVELTWDKDDDDRLQITRRKFNKEDLQDMDFKAYLASSSSSEGEDEDEDINEATVAKAAEGDDFFISTTGNYVSSDEDEENKEGSQVAGTKLTSQQAALRSKYKSLVGNLLGSKNKVQEKEIVLTGRTYEKDQEVEITFKPKAVDKANKMLKERERLRKLGPEGESVFEKERRKLREKRKQRREEPAKRGESVSDSDEDNSNDDAIEDIDDSDKLISDSDGEGHERQDDDDPFFDPKNLEDSEGEDNTEFLPRQKKNEKTNKRSNNDSDSDALISDSEMYSNSNKRSKKSSSKTKEERLENRKKREGEEARSKKERAELELLMMDDEGDLGSGTKIPAKERHFDKSDVIRFEKESKMKRKNKRSIKKQKERLDNMENGGVQEGFKVDIHDSRFGSFYEDHQFSIDPTSSHFKRTEGMSQLLEAKKAAQKQKHTTVAR